MNKLPWFTHDNDAHQDLELRSVLRQLGGGFLRGYGLWWVLVEMLDLHGRGDLVTVSWFDIERVTESTRAYILPALRALEKAGKIQALKIFPMGIAYEIRKHRERNAKRKSGFVTPEGSGGGSGGGSRGGSRGGSLGPSPGGSREGRGEGPKDPSAKASKNAGVRSIEDSAKIPARLPKKEKEKENTLPPSEVDRPGSARASVQPGLFQPTGAVAVAVEALSRCSRVSIKDQTVLETWAIAYPKVDIAKEILACEAWAVSKGERRSPKGWQLTLNTWLKRTQEKISQGGGNAGQKGFAAPKANKYT